MGRNFGWGDVTWGDKAMGRHNLTPFELLRNQVGRKISLTQGIKTRLLVSE